MKNPLFRLTCCLLALLMTSLPALAAAPVAIEAVTASGQLNEPDHTLTLNYQLRLPQLRDDRAEAINAAFAEQIEYYESAYIPMLYSEEDPEWTEADIPIEVGMDYQIRLNDGETISIVYYVSVSLGDSYDETYYAETYDLTTGKRLYLSDALDGDEPALSVAAREIYNQINATTGTAWNFNEGLDENYLAMYLSEESFYLDEDGGIVLFMNPSAITDSRSGICLFPLGAE